jgi:hypothetical protein
MAFLALLLGSTSRSGGLARDFHFYGSDDKIALLRIVMHTDDSQKANHCLNSNIQHWVVSLETSAMLELKRTFAVEGHPANRHTFFVVQAPGGRVDAPACVISKTAPEHGLIDYKKIALGFIAFPRDLNVQAHYFRRFIDPALPLDVRFLNGYKLLEWSFVGDNAGLAKNRDWNKFVSEFDEDFTPLLRPKQKAAGFIEEARAMAAHAGCDERTEEDQIRDPETPMQKAFPILINMVIKYLNNHPLRIGNPIALTPEV